jgi:hypothetical protein
VLAKLALGCVLTLAAGAAYVTQDGFVHVTVEEYRQGGTNLHLVLPAELAPLAAHFIPESKLEQARRHLDEALPLIQMSAEELAKLPDTTLVEVRDERDHVRIAKIGEALQVECNDVGECVFVQVPLRAVYDAAGVLESRSHAAAGVTQ